MQPIRHFSLWLRGVACAAPLVLSACFGPSDLPPPRAGETVETPALLPLAQVLGQSAPGPRGAALQASGAEARAAALRARAAALRAPVIAPSERRRLENAARRLN